MLLQGDEAPLEILDFLFEFGRHGVLLDKNVGVSLLRYRETLRLCVLALFLFVLVLLA